MPFFGRKSVKSQQHSNKNSCVFWELKSLLTVPVEPWIEWIGILFHIPISIESRENVSISTFPMSFPIQWVSVNLANISSSSSKRGGLSKNTIIVYLGLDLESVKSPHSPLPTTKMSQKSKVQKKRPPQFKRRRRCESFLWLATTHIRNSFGTKVVHHHNLCSNSWLANLLLLL